MDWFLNDSNGPILQRIIICCCPKSMAFLQMFSQNAPETCYPDPFRLAENRSNLQSTPWCSNYQLPHLSPALAAQALETNDSWEIHPLRVKILAESSLQAGYGQILRPKPALFWLLCLKHLWKDAKQIQCLGVPRVLSQNEILYPLLLQHEYGKSPVSMGQLDNWSSIHGTCLIANC